MTVCIATSNYLPDEGGITTFNLHLSELLSKADHKVIILTVDYHSDITEADELTEITKGIFLVKLRKSYYLLLQKYRPYFEPGSFDAPGWIAMGYAIRDWLIKNQEEFGIDIIECSDYGGIAAFLTGNGLPPVSITNHGSLTQLLKYNYARKDDHLYVIKKLENIAFKNADGVIVHSPVHKDEHEQFQTTPPFLAPIPFDIKKINREDNNENNYAIVVGGLQPVKGVFILAAALEKSTSSVPVKWVGGDTYTTHSGMSVANKLANEYPEVWNKALQWISSKSYKETITLINNSLFVIIPSLWETFNYVAIEAAALGKAIIMTEKTGASYLFTHEQNALIIPPADSKSLADAISVLLTDRKLREKLGNNARHMIEQQFIPDRIVEARISIYEKIILNNQKIRDNSNSLQFLNNYLTFYRKFYFRVKSIIKDLYNKVIGK